MKQTRIIGAWLACGMLLFAGGQAQAEEDRGTALLQEVDVVHRTVTLNDVKYWVGSFTALEDENGRRLSLEQLPARLAGKSGGTLLSDETAVLYEVGEKRRSGLRTLLRMRFTKDGMPR
jgi:hypothetical protein